MQEIVDYNANIPIVSVVVITYNSSKTILDTLESIKRQSYKRLELVVSDDCSKDNTCEVVDNWLMENSQRFISVVKNYSKTNTGVGGNVNRGILSSSGEWVKCIAGDDILAETCIADNIIYTKTKQEAKIIFSRCIRFDDESGKNKGYNPQNDFILPENNEKQFDILLHKDFVVSVTVFFNREFMIANGLYEERFKFMEDYPTWFKIVKAGHLFYFCDKITVRYRLSSNSLSNSSRLGVPNIKWLTSSYSFFQEELRPELIKRGRYLNCVMRLIDYKLKFLLCRCQGHIVFILPIKILLRFVALYINGYNRRLFQRNN